MSEESLSVEKEPRPRAWLIFDMPGHEGEYVFNIDIQMNPQDVPVDLERKIVDALGKDWSVEARNGGSRLEICNKSRTRDDSVVVETVGRVLGEEYEFHHR